MIKNKRRKDVVSEIIDRHKHKTCSVWYNGKLVLNRGKLLDKSWLNDAVERSMRWRRRHTTEKGHRVTGWGGNK